MKKIIIITILILMFPANAFSFCSDPLAPSPPSNWNKPSKPSVPFCVNEFTNTHTCDDWEISNYNNEIENYRRDLEDYQRELQDYVDQANRFANDAYRYAECEINSIN